ncbi:MAG: superoxide dismutase [Bacteroidia bacterium]|nr:superoxide dismutase [Bacteroidia bacterium]MDW8134282.1 superoxide dismutase [Bacteroidia bacterium]
MNRRTFLASVVALLLGGWRWRSSPLSLDIYIVPGGGYPYELPPLPYPYEALEPYIDAQTMRVHHQGHHATYVSNLNKALAELPAFQSLALEELLTQLDKLPSSHRTTVRNHGGGHWNHTFFWPLLTPKPQSPSSALQKQISAAFGSWDAFRGQLLDAAARHFGSGWAWLVKTPSGQLQITTTPNQDNPLMPYAEVRGKPILGIDVWEHAYYLKYQNKRTEYLSAIWNIINWEKVEALLG